MDKRKGIILAIVLFLIIGLGTFVFAGGDEQRLGSSGDSSENPTEGKDPITNPNTSDDPSGEIDGAGNLTGEGGTDRPGRGDVTTPVIDEVETPETDGNNANTIDWASLLNELAQMVNTAEDRKDIEAAIEFRKNNNITAENIESLGETALDSLKTVNAILDDETAPAIEPDLDGKFFKEVSISINDDTKYTFVLERLDGESIPEGTTLDNINLEGEYKLTVVDAAFNETVVTFTIDRNETEETKTTMDVNNATHFDSIEDAVATITDLSLDKVVVENQDTKESVTFVAENGNVEIKLTEEATYKLTAYDKAGNETTYWLAVDETDPTIFFTDSEGNELSDLTNKDVTITAFDKFLTEVTVTDANGNETVYKEFTTNGNNENKTFTLTLGEDGIYTITAKDKVGRTITETIEIDKTKIAVDHLYVLNNSHNDYEVSDNVRYKVIGNGQDLYVEYVLKEEFSSTPVITIGGQEFEMTCGTALWDDSLYKCDAHITITEDMGLKNGEIIPFTITGVKDIAGNETTVTEENVTVIEKYGRVIYDNEAPIYSSLGLVNITHYIEDSKGDNLFVANIGDTLRVMVRFDELLEVNPTVTLGGVTKEMRFDDKWADYSYWADIKITEDMNLTDGNIDFVISGYADAAGNVGDDLTSSDIKNSSYTGVVLDTTAPTVKFANTHGQKYYNLNYITVVVTENNLSKIYYTWGGSNKYTNATNEIAESLIKDNGDGTYTVSVPTVEGRKKLSIKAVDVAGNVYTGHSTSGWYNIDKTAAEVTVSYDPATDTNGIVTATLTANEKITIADTSWEKVSDTVYKKEYSDNATEEIVVTDRVGLETKVNVSVTNIDKVAPTVEFANTHGQKYYNKDYITVVVTENNLSKVYYAWGGSNKYTNATNEIAEDLITNNGDGTYTVSVPTVEGRKKLSIKAVDAAGNVYTGHSTSGWYNIDTINPYLEGLVSGTQAFTVSLKAVDDNFDYIKLTNNDTNQVINESREWTSFGGDVYVGKWTAQVYDKAGNVSDEYTFEILPEGTTTLVNGVAYDTFLDALRAAKGSTITLVDDVVLDYNLKINTDVVIDLNNNDLSLGSHSWYIMDGSVKLTGEGTFESSKSGRAAFEMYGTNDANDTDYSSIYIGKDVTIKANNGIYIFNATNTNTAYGVKVVVEGTIDASSINGGNAYYGIYLQGLVKNYSNYPTITLTETAKITSDALGIYAAGYATWNINGAYIEGVDSAIGIKSGVLNMTSGTLKATGQNSMPTDNNGNGINPSGAALQIESNKGYAGEIEINISGGALISENAVPIYEYDSTNVATKIKTFNISGGNFLSNNSNVSTNLVFSNYFTDKHSKFISGGTYNYSPKVEYIADGYISELQSDGTYKVIPNN